MNKVVLGVSLLVLLLFLTWAFWLSPIISSDGITPSLNDRSNLTNPSIAPDFKESMLNVDQDKLPQISIIPPIFESLGENYQPDMKVAVISEKSIKTEDRSIATLTPTLSLAVTPQLTLSPTIVKSSTISPLPSPTQYIPTETPFPSPPTNTLLDTHIELKGNVVGDDYHYYFNQKGGLHITNNQLTMSLTKHNDKTDLNWLNFRVKMHSTETLAGFDDPSLVVLINDKPLFGIGILAYRQIITQLEITDGWLSISLKIPTEYFCLDFVESDFANQIVFMSGENGDLNNPTEVEIQLEGFSLQPQHLLLQSFILNSLSAMKHDRYLKKISDNEYRNIDFYVQSYLLNTPHVFATNSCSVESENQDRYSSFRISDGLLWFSESLTNYGYGSFVGEVVDSAWHVLPPFNLNQLITVLPELN